ncbi:MAG TPA: ABC transporter ATP-binding protein [Sphaerochaeta sp.]|jgi:iron complex transport system ATP-binding protein|nr:ABC transporter ATP-binding protein [Sphaerochaeta sp.]
MYSLETRGLTGGYDKQEVFTNLDLAIPEGKFIALTGPNGSGKSTLLKFFYKELIPSLGTVHIGGSDVSSLKQKEIAKKLGFVPQNGKIDYDFSVLEAVSMGRYAYGGHDEEGSVEQAMRDCDILHLSNKRVTELSGGEMQRVLLARSLCQRGKVLLLDEPVNHLDVKHQRTMMNLLQRLVEKEMSVICVLHDLLLVQVYSEETILLTQGRVYANGPTQEVICHENLKAVYNINAHKIFDPSLGRDLWMPTWC